MFNVIVNWLSEIQKDIVTKLNHSAYLIDH